MLIQLAFISSLVLCVMGIAISSNASGIPKSVFRKIFLILCIISIFALVDSTYAAVISEETAYQVAQNYLKAHISEHGNWNGETAPSVGDIQVLSYEGTPIGYLVNIVPSGHMLVAYYDDFSPVLFYSPASGLDISKVDDPNSIESWIIPEIYNNVSMINGPSTAHSMQAVQPSAKYNSEQGMKIISAWEKMSSPSYVAPPKSASIHALDLTSPSSSSAGQTSVGPVLQTTWNQGDPWASTDPKSNWFIYNLYTPAEPAVSGNPACPHAWTGCVATAMSQVMKYWNWPDVGVGSNSYKWNGTSFTGATISANFEHPYDW
ncbi:MAG: C10 family peptidase, partial [Dissulfurispiraceae bacterium]